ncbi:glycosyltransferase WbuB [Cupriavidus pauculus]|uniref:Colanic acid biosynthesis glycosyltransferase WcaI n=1 Tax=Cupriavidus pauculus TaxID=82633 RepID=A0A2N5C4D5_9BURK|nr:glycosyltransferase WbuB [Cupriavidus pauculus]PLP97072.1 colanic acid biosynthesis glycosyltransferase WcaI [Cupriavidus pauculus]
MKILMYGLNYAPELTGIGKYMAEQADWLAAQGHEIRVIAAPPYYPAWRIGPGYSAWRYQRERMGAVDVWRAPLWVPARPGGLKRLLHLASFAIGSLPSLLAQRGWKPDVVFVVEPPLMCAPAALLFSRWCGSRTWLHVQDYEVDAAFALGLLKRPWLRALATRFERALLRRFDRVSTISTAMVALARAKGVPAAKTMLLPNWATLHDTTAADGRAFRQELGIAPDAVVALYSGNMGAKQGLELLTDAATRLGDHPGLHFVFCGEGSGQAALASACAELPQVSLLPLQPSARFASLLDAADIHLLPQHAGAADLVMPSKLTGMLASGRPVVATALPGSSLAEVVSQCGRVVPPGDGAAFTEAIATLAAAPAERLALGRAGRAWAEQNLDQDVVLGRLEQAMLALVRGRAPAADKGVEASVGS